MDEVRIKFIEEITTLSAIFKYQLGCESVSKILDSCKVDAENMGKIQEAFAEVKQHYNDKYNAMNNDYWEGARYVLNTIAKHLGINEEEHE